MLRNYIFEFNVISKERGVPHENWDHPVSARVEANSFDDAIGELERVLGEPLSHMIWKYRLTSINALV